MVASIEEARTERTEAFREREEALREREEALREREEARTERIENIRAREEEREMREQELLEKCLRHLPDYGAEISRLDQTHCSKTGTWIASDHRFESWIDETSGQRALWLTGIPGAGTSRQVRYGNQRADCPAGKTYLCFAILRHLEMNVKVAKSANLLYAFPTYDCIGGNTSIAIFESFVYQICQSNPLLTPVVTLDYQKSRGHFRPPARFLAELLEKLICGTEPTYMIVDGLDECEESQRKEILETIICLSQKCSNLRVLFSSRREVDIDRVLQGICQIVPVDQHNRGDIQSYVTVQLQEICQKARTSGDLVANIKSLVRPIVTQANGKRAF